MMTAVALYAIVSVTWVRIALVRNSFDVGGMRMGDVALPKAIGESYSTNMH